MRIVVPHTRAYHPLARATHDRFRGVERVDVSASPTAYFELVGSLWADGEGFLIVEHDIELSPKAAAQAKHCRCLWGVSPYQGPGAGTDLLVGSLGCTRFSTRLLREHPGLFAEQARLQDPGVEAGDWRRLDVRLGSVLTSAGLAPHAHLPPVVHHHVYRGVCVCGQNHRPYPVDSHGRYSPA